VITLEVIDGINRELQRCARWGQGQSASPNCHRVRHDTLVTITNVVGSLRDDVIIGNGQDNRLDGQSAAT